MKKINKVIIFFLTLSIFLISVLASVTTSVFELNFYSEAQKKYDVAQKMNLSQKQVNEATTVALLYTKGLTNNLEYNVKIEDQVYDVYSTQDKEHMIDVKNLYTGVYRVLVISAVVLMISSVILFIKRKKINKFSSTLLFNKLSLYTLIAVGFLALFAWVNFDQFWTMFHKVFFTNDLWLMNPRKDALVNLFPANLFMDLVFKIIFRFIFIFGLVNIAAYAYRHITIRKRQK